ncbi:MAG: NAD(P)/FAD-dependent oxidoreductase, partial [Wujia sp.]
EVKGRVVEDEDVQSDSDYDVCSNGIKKCVKGVRISCNDGTVREDYYDKVVVCTGGLSYPLTGSTGDGISWARELGLRVETPRPALSPIKIQETICGELMGLSLKNIKVTFVSKIKNKEKIIYEDFGEMLFTHFGVSGPVILSASSYIGRYINQPIKMFIDLKPALSYEQLDTRILRDFSGCLNKQFRNSLGELLPKSLIPVIIRLSDIDEYKRVNEVTREERQKLVHIIKHLEFNVSGLSGFDDAIITHGGVSVKELNPSDMSCKSIKGLSFAGEVIDVDALTGGFNLQIAWSTAAALE